MKAEEGWLAEYQLYIKKIIWDARIAIWENKNNNFYENTEVL